MARFKGSLVPPLGHSVMTKAGRSVGPVEAALEAPMVAGLSADDPAMQRPPDMATEVEVVGAPELTGCSGADICQVGHVPASPCRREACGAYAVMFWLPCYEIFRTDLQWEYRSVPEKFAVIVASWEGSPKQWAAVPSRMCASQMCSIVVETEQVHYLQRLWPKELLAKLVE